MHALAVDDDKLLNWSLSSFLSKWGFKVQTVLTGNDALARIEKSGFDVVLSGSR
jgi:DNA-binding response OmpR family regulator